MRLLITIIALVLFVSCNKKQEVNSILSANNLPTQVLNIDITKDTVITTANGAIITIPKGTLLSDSTNVQLELKEAYSMQQIMLAGLTTKTTDGKVLQSGGMFYLNPNGNTKVTIAKPISIKVPTTAINDSMKLYKGVEKDGKIAWEKPIPFKVKSPSNKLIDGKALFASNCAQCHGIYKDGTGPALGNIGRKRSKWYLQTFTNNWEEAVAAGDCQAINIISYASSAMNKFNLDTNEIDVIYDYIDAISAEMGIPFVDDGIKGQQDSCEQYRKEVLQLANLEKQKNKLIDDNGDFVKKVAKNQPIANSSTNIPVPINPTIEEPLKDLVKPITKSSTYYELEITQFGWNNLDDRPSFNSVELFVNIDEKYKGNVKLYLAIPQLRILLDGGEAINGMYAFAEKNGKIELPIGREIVLIAVGEEDGDFLFGKIDFTVKDKQQINIPIAVSTKSAFNNTILTMGWNGLDIKAQEAKNASAIKAVEYEINKIKNLKPMQGCDCTSFKSKTADSIVFVKK